MINANQYVAVHNIKYIRKLLLSELVSGDFSIKLHSSLISV